MNNDLISRSALLENYGLKNAVKYGNETAEQQHNSYSTLMLYEVADMIEDAPAVDAVEVVRCRDCENRSPSPFGHPHLRWCKILGDHCTLDFYCGFGKRREKRNAAD